MELCALGSGASFVDGSSESSPFCNRGRTRISRSVAESDAISATCAACPRSARSSPRCSWCRTRRMPLVLKAAARSLEHRTLEIRHRELAGNLPLTALWVTAGGATIQQTSSHGEVFPTKTHICPCTEGKPHGSLVRSCSAPTQDDTPNGKF